MKSFDDIFTASNLDQNKKRAQMIFGRLLINLRKNNHIKMYSMLGGVVDTNIVDNVIKITLSDKTSYDMLNNSNDIATLNDIVKGIDGSLDVEILCSEEEAFDIHSFKVYLAEEFGKMLTIK